MVIFAVALFMNRQQMRHMIDKVTEDNPLILYAGYLHISVGMLLVVSHNIWVWNWPVIITILGWGAVLRGIVVLCLPSQLMKIKRSLIADSVLTSVGIFALIFGVVLSYYGYIVK